MTVIIYYDDKKENFQVIHPKTSSKNPKENFDGNVRMLVEQVTHSNTREGIKNYHSFEVIDK